MYTLTKLSIAEGQNSMVGVGANVTGALFKITEYGHPNIPCTPSELEVGDQVFVTRAVRDWISTSALKRIEKNEGECYTLWTQTSVYRLEEER